MMIKKRPGLFIVAILLGSASMAYAQFPYCVTDFGDGTNNEQFVGPGVDPFTGAGAEVIFQEPELSGSTMGIDVGTDPDGLPVTGVQTVQFAPMEDFAYEIRFPWLDATSTNGTEGVRATSVSALNLDSPSVHLAGTIRFRIAVTAFDYLGTNSLPAFGAQESDGTASIFVALAVRETGNDLPQGASDTGGGDLEYIYPTTVNGSPAFNIIPTADTNGLIPFPPAGFRMTGLSSWPPLNSQFVELEFDLAEISMTGALRGFANNGDGVNTAGDGVLDASLNPGGDGVNRGTLESIIFTKDPTDNDAAGGYFFIYLDEVRFEAPVPDSTVLPPSIQGPLTDSQATVLVNTKVNLCDGSGVDSAQLFIDGSSAGIPSVVPVNGVATFNGLSLSTGQVVTATQTKDGVTSNPSLPIVVFGPGVIMADNFDTYASQSELNTFWQDSIGSPTPPDAKLLLSTGGAASCDNMIREFNPPSSDAARLFRPIGSVNGTDEEPLVVRWNFQHRGSGTVGSRTRLELARFNGDFSASAAARLKGTTGIVLENGPASVPLPDTLNEYNILLISSNGLPTAGTNGFFLGNQGNVANTGIERVADTWHTMEIHITSNSINYFVDDVLANPVDVDSGGIGSNGTPLWPGGVPRPSKLPYTHVVVGQGFSNNGPEMLFDNVSVTIGTNAIPFGDPIDVPAPTVAEPLFPGSTVVLVENVDSNATQVDLFVGASNFTSTGAGVFLDNQAEFTVPALANGVEIGATQTVGGVESCLSATLLIGVPPVTVESGLVPGQTTVEVSDLREGEATQVTVYVESTATQIGFVSNPATDPVTVTVTGLVNGDTIVATQTLSGVESDFSAGTVVGVPAPTLPGPLVVGDTVVTVSDVHPLADKVTVLVDGTTAGIEDVSASSLTTVDVTIGSSLFVDETVTATQTIGGVLGPESNAITISLPMCLIVFEDPFETDTSAGWNENISDAQGANDAGATFAFDYDAAGVPASPNGSGSTLGLKLEANNFDLSGGAASVTVSPTGQAFVGSNGYRIAMDMWINANGPFPLGGTGSTEFMGPGCGYDDVTPNVGATGSGAWFVISGESGSSGDVRAFKDAARQFPESGQFAAGTASGVADNTNNDVFYSNLFGSPSPPAAQTLLFGTQSGTLLGGSAGFAWHVVDLTVLGTKAKWSLNETAIVTIDETIGAPFSGLDGNVSITYFDPFSSVSDNPAMSFGLADNVKVFVPHTPGTNGDYDGDALVDADDVRYIPECLAGPGVTPIPAALGLNCANACESAFDFDSDGDVDLRDAAEFQRAFP